MYRRVADAGGFASTCSWARPRTIDWIGRANEIPRCCTGLTVAHAVMEIVCSRGRLEHFLVHRGLLVETFHGSCPTDSNADAQQAFLHTT